MRERLSSGSELHRGLEAIGSRSHSDARPNDASRICIYARGGASVKLSGSSFDEGEKEKRGRRSRSAG